MTSFSSRVSAKSESFFLFFVNSSLARAIDQEVRKIVDECYARARELLKKNKAKLKLLAETLLEREVMDGEEVAKLVGIKKEFPKQKK